MTQAGLDEDRHYSVLLGSTNNNIRIKVACGSGSDVSVSQCLGFFVRELTGEVVNTTGGGPLLVDCSKHGKFLGLLEILSTGPKSPSGQEPITMPLLLIPLHDIEYVLPLEQAERLRQ